MADWGDLNADQQCVLQQAVEEDFPSGVLVGCTNEPDWPARVAHVLRMAEIIEDLVSRGLVEVTRDAGDDGAPPVDVLAGDVHDVLHDAANWWSPEGIRQPMTALALAETGAGQLRPIP